jgi:CRP-like cAMP-binding protein
MRARRESFSRDIREGRVHQHPNKLLARLPADVLRQIESHLTVADMPYGEVLAETHDRVHKLYFPHTGIISCVVELIGGGAIETGMIGNDGQFGAGPILDDRLSLNHVVIQVGGQCSVMKAANALELVDAHPEFRKLLLSYEQFLLAQVQQTAACNASHIVLARTCKWLLRMHALAGTELPITQEFLAQMMGVRRTSVTNVAIDLQKAGLISYSRGRIHIHDIERIRSWACECDDTLATHYKALFGDDGT